MNYRLTDKQKNKLYEFWVKGKDNHEKGNFTKFIRKKSKIVKFSMVEM